VVYVMRQILNVYAGSVVQPVRAFACTSRNCPAVPDEFDKAQATQAINTDDALERQRIIASKTQHLLAIGECLNQHCAEPFAANDNTRLFCGPRCEAEHRKLRRA
jgi:hypothetical protein